jgi:hypothetical protein
LFSLQIYWGSIREDEATTVNYNVKI